MIEDKLTHDERIRLECLAQANAVSLHQPIAVGQLKRTKDLRDLTLETEQLMD